MRLDGPAPLSFDHGYDAEQDGIHADHDRDGVSDETEKWLGTSSFTDESGVDGRTDSGGIASVDRLERVERALSAADEKERAWRDQSGVRDERRVLGDRPAPLSSSSVGLLMAQIVASDGRTRA